MLLFPHVEQQPGDAGLAVIASPGRVSTTRRGTLFFLTPELRESTSYDMPYYFIDFTAAAALRFGVPPSDFHAA